MAVSYMELTYPSKFNFNNQKNYYFELPANASGNYLEIDNFNTGGTPPVLMDLTTGNRFTGDIATAGKVKFVLPPSATLHKFILVSQDASNVNTAASPVQRNFVNYAIASNQGDYLIISHASLTSASGVGDPVEEYKNYRSSAQGGSYNAKVYDIDELVDQFGYGIKKNPLSIKNFLKYARQEKLFSKRYF